MKEYNISDGKGAKYKIFEHQVENVKPLDFYKDIYVEPAISNFKDIMLYETGVSNPVMDKLIRRKFEKEWESQKQELLKVELSKNFIDLLKVESKAEQVKLLKGQGLTPEQLAAFLIRAGEEFGYKLTQFSAEHLHSGIEMYVLPKTVEIKGDEVIKVGNTSLSDGQLKQLVAQRKKTVTRILDNGKNWHCLFNTYRSLRGEESWKNGQPHFHYISDKFGLDKPYVIDSLKSKYYKLNSLPHIDLLNYR